MKTLFLHSTLLIAILCSDNVTSQRICDTSKKTIILSKGVSVNIYKEKGSTNYYYVPTQLQLSTKNGRPEYSFQEYKKNANASPDGAIFHCLVTWGINTMQLQELKQRIKGKYGKNAILAGAIYLEKDSPEIHFNTAKPIGRILKNALKSKGSLPTISGSKMALSFHLKKTNVITIREALKNPQRFNGVSISLHYKYNTYTCNSGINSAKKNTIKVTGQLKNWF